MRINTNMNAMIATNQMAKNTALSGKSMEKLSTGLRINKAGDDAAGLAVSEKMRSQIRGMQQADRNVQDGISMVQTAEGALEEAGNIAQRMRELGVQAGNDTLSATDRDKVKEELTQLQQEMNQIGKETKFNGKNLLSGAGAFTIQAGANNETRTINTIDLVGQAKTLASMDVSSSSKAQAYVSKVDAALEQINTGRAKLGATQNRLEYTSANLTTSTENLSAAESRIRDVDVAKEMVNLSKLNILNQAAQAMVGQANQQPQSVTQLLR
ncbi:MULTISPECIES: flagellin [Romboutsia]|uniref:Flagellin n=1 Tax=Romboutsia hominis TaxID=1507512 RepID=A0A2P2BPI5_9FIRM|nr:MULTISPECIES: flagellin [Romboutsia]MCH1959570.1 flagellin [Romboutsia hominis]MCH1970007.1 flagellin [Romboutsia hominis]MDB8792344.1 flagellin [Romboutsia sp. 1001216sp1]MDB8795639.1 flagellin [Romboutsia sp. 1001216sp1]MDB8798482.1 flagellin [Romboutsia sp. 1001216sp1]